MAKLERPNVKFEKTITTTGGSFIGVLPKVSITDCRLLVAWSVGWLVDWLSHAFGQQFICNTLLSYFVFQDFSKKRLEEARQREAKIKAEKDKLRAGEEIRAKQEHEERMKDTSNDPQIIKVTNGKSSECVYWLVETVFICFKLKLCTFKSVGLSVRPSFHDIIASPPPTQPIMTGLLCIQPFFV